MAKSFNDSLVSELKLKNRALEQIQCLKLNPQCTSMSESHVEAFAKQVSSFIFKIFEQFAFENQCPLNYLPTINNKILKICFKLQGLSSHHSELTTGPMSIKHTEKVCSENIAYSEGV